MSFTIESVPKRTREVAFTGIKACINVGVGGNILDFLGNEGSVFYYVSRNFSQSCEDWEKESVRCAARWALDSAPLFELLRITTAREAAGAALFIRNIDDAANRIVERWLRRTAATVDSEEAHNAERRPLMYAATVDSEAHNAAVHVLLEAASSRCVMNIQHKREAARPAGPAGRIAPVARQFQKESCEVSIGEVFHEHLNKGSAEQLLAWISEGAPCAPSFTRCLLPFHRDGEECLIDRADLTRRCLSAPSAAAIADVVTAAIRVADVSIAGAGESRSVLTSPLNEAIALLRFLSIAVQHLTEEEPFNTSEDQKLRHSTDMLRAVRLIKVRHDAAAEAIRVESFASSSASTAGSHTPLTEEQKYICKVVKDALKNSGVLRTNVVVKATAGSGKTFVIKKLCEIAYELYPHQVLYLVFNRYHQTNWKGNTNCLTMDSLVLRHCQSAVAVDIKIKPHQVNTGKVAEWLRSTQALSLAKDEAAGGLNATDNQWAKYIRSALQKYLRCELRDCDPLVFYTDQSRGSPFSRLEFQIEKFHEKVKKGSRAYKKRCCITAAKVVGYARKLWMYVLRDLRGEGEGKPKLRVDFDSISKVLQLRTAGCSFKDLDSDLKHIDSIPPLLLQAFYRLVCIDEAQDMNACKRSLFVALQLEKHCKRPFCVVSVGDPFQNIQCYAGATAQIDILGGRDGVFGWGRQIMCALTSTFRMGPLAAEACNLLREYKLIKHVGNTRSYAGKEEDSFRVIGNGPHPTRVFTVPLIFESIAGDLFGGTSNVDGIECFKAGVRASRTRWASEAAQVPKEVWLLDRTNVGCFMIALATHQVLLEPFEEGAAGQGGSAMPLSAVPFNARQFRFLKSTKMPPFVLELLVILTHPKTCYRVTREPTLEQHAERASGILTSLRRDSNIKERCDRLIADVYKAFTEVGDLWDAFSTKAARSGDEEEEEEDDDDNDGAGDSISDRWIGLAIPQVLRWCEDESGHAIGSAVAFCHNLLTSNSETREPPANSRWPMIHVKTTHQAKGCENETIWLGGGCFAPYQNNKKDAKSILNVAATRVQKELVLNHEFAKLLEVRWGARTKLPVLFDDAAAAAATAGDEVDTYFN